MLSRDSVRTFLFTYRWEIGIFALALVVRLLYLGASIVTYGDGNLLQAISGADGYYAVSKNLIEGNGLSSSAAPPYEPYSFRPPLYHYFIAGAHWLLGGYLGVILLQIGIGSILPVLGMRLAGHLIESPAWLRTIGIFLALEPSAILYSTVFYSEIFFMLLLFGSFLALFSYLRGHQRWLLIVSAILLALATLSRPTTQFMPVLVVAILLWSARAYWSKRAFIAPLAYVVVFLAVLSPWVYRNWVTFGVVGISPQTGVNLRMTLLPTVYSIERGTTFQAEFAALEAAGVKGPNNASITDAESYARTALPELLARPKALALSVANSLWSFFTLDGLYDFLRHVEVRPKEVIGRPAIAALATDPGSVLSYFARNLWGPVAFILGMRLFWIVLALACIGGVVRYIRVHGLRPVPTFIIAVLLYMAATSAITGYGLTARYRLPVNVFVVAFAAYGIAALAPRARLFVGRTASPHG